MRRGQLCVEAVHASHVHRLVAGGLLALDGSITEEGERRLAEYRRNFASR